jgi:hypothetical protein
MLRMADLAATFFFRGSSTTGHKKGRAEIPRKHSTAEFEEVSSIINISIVPSSIMFIQFAAKREKRFARQRQSC